jgi:glucose/arabinose dehydrogenase
MQVPAWWTHFLVPIALTIMTILTPVVVSAQTPTSSFDPAGYSPNFEPVVTGLSSPVQMVDPGDDSGRFFVAQQSGQVVIVQDGAVTGNLLDISGQISTGSEQGLLSIALHPEFSKNGRLYIDYTDVNGNTQIEEWALSADDQNVADPASAKTILTVEQPYPNHNGGLLMFGPDGYLYIGLGDGGSQGDPNGNGQNLGVLLGKILRIDIDHTDGDLPYAIPTDNPFIDRDDARSEIWAYGLRNPWRFSFDRETGDLYIGDVGQSEIEEADFQPAGDGGLNFGWNAMEGSQCYSAADCDQSAYSLPFFEYTHSSGAGCSISGGYVYRGDAIEGLKGAYLAGDYCTGYLWAVNPETGAATDALETGLSISSFAEDAAGELYIVDLNGGIYKLVP